MKKIRLIFIPVFLLSLACIVVSPVPTDAINSVGTSVSETLTALVPTTATATSPTVTLESGFISGHLSYPSDFIPPLRIVAWSVADGSYYYLDTPLNTFEYTLEVPAGTYNVIAYVIPAEGLPSDYAGGYTQMVPCGLSYGCDDHSLIPVTVEAGSTASNIDPGDWYATAPAFPPMP
jgi:hypothetical protein